MPPRLATHHLQPSGHALELGQLREHAIGRATRADAQSGGDEGIGGLIAADQRDGQLALLALVPDRDALVEAVADLLDNSDEFAAHADCHDLQAAPVSHLGYALGLAAVSVDHGRRALGQQFVEQAQLGQEVVLGVLVIVEMVVTEVEERASREAHAIEAALRQAVAGSLHGEMLDAVLRQLGQHGVQRHGIGRSEAFGCRAIGADQAERAEIGGPEAHTRPDLAHEVSGGRLAAGAGDGDDGLRLMAIEPRRHLGQRQARVVRAHHRHFGADREQHVIADQHCGCPRLYGLGHKARAVEFRSRHGGEQETRFDGAAVGGDADDIDRPRAGVCR